jgi:uncharacterized integral membrane protein (TIGR00698 family)
VIALGSFGLEWLERYAFSYPYVGAIVVAILIGTAIRSFWNPSTRWVPGIAFSAKQLLEVAVALFGASTSFVAIAASSAMLLCAVALTVVVALGIGFGVGRFLGLSTQLSTLIACGNAICGNSAIIAVAPAIGASERDIASAISFTAILGVFTVLGLPLLIPLFHLSETQYGIIAGLTVYAVPQILAATAPAGAVSTQVGTLVKLIRVLMLGPVIVGLSFAARLGGARWVEPQKASLFFRCIPWFVLCFLTLSALRSFSILPADVVHSFSWITTALTIVSMAALGLGVDVRILTRVGGKIAAAVTLSLLLLLSISISLALMFE